MFGWNRIVSFSHGDDGDPLTGVLALIDQKTLRDAAGAFYTQWCVDVSEWTRYPSGALLSAGHQITWERFPGVVRTATLGKPIPPLTTLGGAICFPFNEEN